MGTPSTGGPSASSSSSSCPPPHPRTGAKQGVAMGLRGWGGQHAGWGCGRRDAGSRGPLGTQRHHDSRSLMIHAPRSHTGPEGGSVRWSWGRGGGPVPGDGVPAIQWGDAQRGVPEHPDAGGGLDARPGGRGRLHPTAPPPRPQGVPPSLGEGGGVYSPETHLCGSRPLKTPSMSHWTGFPVQDHR